MSKRLSATMSMRRSSTRRCASASLSNTSRTVSGPNERLSGANQGDDDLLHHHAPPFQIDSDLCDDFPITSVGALPWSSEILACSGKPFGGLTRPPPSRSAGRVSKPTSNCQPIESTIGPTNRPIMPCTSVPPRTPSNMTGIGVPHLGPLATSGRNILSSNLPGPCKQAETRAIG